MNHKGYRATIEYDDEAEIFHGRIDLTRDVVTFQGDSVPELKREMAASIEDYLELCAARGEEAQPPRSSIAQAA